MWEHSEETLSIPDSAPQLRAPPQPSICLPAPQRSSLPSSHAHPPRSRHSLACQAVLFQPTRCTLGYPHTVGSLSSWVFLKPYIFMSAKPVGTSPSPPHPAQALGGCFGGESFLSCHRFFFELSAWLLPPLLQPQPFQLSGTWLDLSVHQESPQWSRTHVSSQSQPTHPTKLLHLSPSAGLAQAYQ